MAFNNDITLAGTSTSKTYSWISLDNKKCIRQDATAPLDAPRKMTISHQEVTRSYGVADRHLIRLDFNSVGVSPIPTVLGTLGLTLEVPRVNFTLAQVTDLKDQLVSFLNTAGNLAKILNSEP
jgi:hypothetical protein